MPDRVVVFLDWQNVYKGAREAFCTLQAPHWQGQVDPVALAEHLAADSPFSRELKQVRIYRGHDYVVMAVRREFEVGILMSTDTDMKPALEAVAALTSTRGTRAEVAAWSAAGRHNRRLSIRSWSLYCHWVGKDIYQQVADSTDYSV